MLITSKRIATAIAASAAAMLVLTGCGGGGSSSTKTQNSVSLNECDKKPNECNSGPSKSGGTLTLALEKKLVNWNINSSKGNILDISDALAPVLPFVILYYPDNTAHVNTNLLDSAEITSKDPQTVVYKIKKEAAWSDGTPISAKDFTFAWKTQNGKDCPDCDFAATTGYELIKSITGSDNDKTVTVVFDKPFPDWMGLFWPMYPAHVAEKAGDLTSPAGLLKAWDSFKDKPFEFSGGAYKVGGYEKDVSLTLVPNEKYWGEKPKLDKIVYRIITDQSAEISALKNKEVQMSTAQPSQALIDQVKTIQGLDYALTTGPSWEHIMFNTKNKYLADPVLRQAIATAINRKEIISKTIGTFFPAAAPLGNHMLLPGQPGFKDNVAGTGYGDGDTAKATKLLTDAGYTVAGGTLKTKAGEAVPEIRFVYTEGNKPRADSALLVQNELKAIGINIKVSPTPSLGDSLDNRDFDLIQFAYVGGPLLTGAIDEWRSTSTSNYSGINNADADKLLNALAVELDPAKAADQANQVSVILIKEMVDLPLLQKPTFVGLYHDFVNIRPNATQMGPQYNTEQWAMRDTTAK
jgi:peptide/nickel transport system substrate-binding protein